jgi:hypothetical protein
MRCISIVKKNSLKKLFKNKEIESLGEIKKIEIDESVARVDSAIVDKSKIQ